MPLAPAVVFLASAGACFVPDLDLAGFHCDADHPCVTGTVCKGGACVAGAAPDGGPQPGGDAGPDAGPRPDAGADGGPSGCTPGCPTAKRCLAGACVPCAPVESACDDGDDEDCNGLTDCRDPACAGLSCGGGGRCRTPDGGTSLCCTDGDLDGYEDARCGGEDCDDGNRAVNPAALEGCGDAVDGDCDGKVDLGRPYLLGPSTGLLAATSRAGGGFAVLNSTVGGYSVFAVDARGSPQVTPLMTSTAVVPYDAQIARAGSTFAVLATTIFDGSGNVTLECATFTESTAPSRRSYAGRVTLPLGVGHIVAVAGTPTTLSFIAPDNAGKLVHVARSTTLACPTAFLAGTFVAQAVALASLTNRDAYLYVTGAGDLVLVDGASSTNVDVSTSRPAAPVVVPTAADGGTPFGAWIAEAQPAVVTSFGGTGSTLAGPYLFLSGAAGTAGVRLAATASLSPGFEVRMLLGGTNPRTLVSPAANQEVTSQKVVAAASEPGL